MCSGVYAAEVVAILEIAGINAGTPLLLFNHLAEMSFYFELSALILQYSLGCPDAGICKPFGDSRRSSWTPKT